MRHSSLIAYDFADDKDAVPTFVRDINAKTADLCRRFLIDVAMLGRVIHRPGE